MDRYSQISVDVFHTEAFSDTDFYLLPGGVVVVETLGAAPEVFRSEQAAQGPALFAKACCEWAEAQGVTDEDGDA
jgi:hypothetical protein